MNWLLYGDVSPTPTNLTQLILSVLLAFTCGHLIAICYTKTHSGMSYSRTFVCALLIIPVLVSLVMNVLNNNLVTAFGMMAVFAIVRFRNVLRDTLDTVYILSTLFIGMASGTQKYSTTAIGCVAILLILLYIHFTAFGTRNRYDLVLSLHWEGSDDLKGLLRVIKCYSSRVTLANQRASGGEGGVDLSYRLMMRDPKRATEFVERLKATAGVAWVSSVKAEEESEY